MGLIKEFREFAIKGNVVDLAIAVVLGAAFGKIVTAVTNAFIMPIIGLVAGKAKVDDLTTNIGGTVFPYGLFLQAVIDFFFIALVLFIFIKTMNTLNRQKEAKAEEPPTPTYTLTEQLLMDIRDGVNGRRQ